MPRTNGHFERALIYNLSTFRTAPKGANDHRDDHYFFLTLSQFSNPDDIIFVVVMLNITVARCLTSQLALL